jgi:hypothetical protein
MSKSSKLVLEEVKKLKAERKKIKDTLKAWAEGSTEIYDENGMRMAK